MADGIDKSLLDRLQALRVSSTSPEKPPSNPIKFDVIERAKTPTGGDLLAARLKSLRTKADSPASQSISQPTSSSFTQNDTTKSPTITEKDDAKQPLNMNKQDLNEDVDALFQTDDKALEEMLADLDLDTPPEPTTTQPEEPKDEDVKALLEQLSASIPRNTNYSDDSDGESMTRETNDVMAQFKDAAELDAFPQTPPDKFEDKNLQSATIELPSVPETETETSTSSTQIADLTARMAALRQDDILPSVPTSKPTKPVNRLTSKTSYTDDDVDSWCTVCLDDATLRCLGCDEDVYCTRCWREMHIGPAAHFDDRSHKAVQFTRDRKKENRIAMGA